MATLISRTVLNHEREMKQGTTPVEAECHLVCSTSLA